MTLNGVVAILWEFFLHYFSEFGSFARQLRHSRMVEVRQKCSLYSIIIVYPHGRINHSGAPY